ncbi:FimV/HubP family polar landmark protein [Legionella dresdenensis]|uniref:FimV/HubP family polar landmark protein n=1 Tax=Legionella dresdenensis TaxID=450200 RepID=A0ABV8CG98_9GAMM
MNRKKLYTSILLLSLPLSSFALGMGDMAVKSYLNQHFQAEIPLIDVDGIPLSGIKAHLALPEEYEQLGLVLGDNVSLLSFNVTKNASGKPVIAINSSERITEPYLEVVVDLAWPQGQLYRAYTILLDPPNYQLSTRQFKPNSKYLAPMVMRGQPGVIDKPVYNHIVEQQPPLNTAAHKDVIYGPTLANENIWQIAQRYSVDGASLQQVILAIVGTNSQAFTQGNLNGLKAGERLQIPAREEILKVPDDLAKQEVEAHDAAWQAKQEIKHVLLPPYINGETGASQFPQPQVNTTPAETPVNNAVSHDKSAPAQGMISTLMAVPQSFFGSESTESAGSHEKFKAEIDINAAAIDTVRTENTRLKDKIGSLETKNSELEQKLTRQTAEMARLRQQIQAIVKQRQGLKAQVNQLADNTDDSSSLWISILFAAGLIGGYGVLYWWWHKLREERAQIAASSNSPEPEPETITTEPPKAEPPTLPPFVEPEPVQQMSAEQPVIGPEEELADEAQPGQNLPVAPEEAIEPEQEDDNIVTAPEQPVNPDDYILDFEPGLDKVITQQESADIDVPVAEQDDNTLDFVVPDKAEFPAEPAAAEQVADDESSEAVIDFQPEQNQDKPVKSKSALDTLLALAKTYIGMDDPEAARQSLQEVIDFGDEAQRSEAEKLMKELEQKN